MADPLIVADFSGNGRINAIDAAKIAQFVAQIPVGEIPPLPAGVAPSVHRQTDTPTQSGPTDRVPSESDLVPPTRELAGCCADLLFDVTLMEAIDLATWEKTEEYIGVARIFHERSTASP